MSEPSTEIITRTETEQPPIGETVPAEMKRQGPGSPSIRKQTKVSKNTGKMCLGHRMLGGYRAGVLERGNRRVRMRVAPATCLERAFRPWEWWGPGWRLAAGVEGVTTRGSYMAKPGRRATKFSMAVVAVLGETTQQRGKHRPWRSHSVGNGLCLPGQSSGVNTSVSRNLGGMSRKVPPQWQGRISSKLRPLWFCLTRLSTGTQEDRTQWYPRRKLTTVCVSTGRPSTQHRKTHKTWHPIKNYQNAISVCF